MGKLENLLVDESALDREALGEALLPYVRIGSDGSFRPAKGWAGLNRIRRVLTVLLAAKAAHVLKVRSDEAVSALDVATMSGVPGNTSRPVLRGLLQRGLLAQDGAARYFVPNMAVPEALALLQTSTD